jgi:hypothetical protein
LLTAQEIDTTGARPWGWGQVDPEVQAIITQTADPLWRSLEAAWFPALRSILDGRNSLRDLPLPASVTYRGVGGRR